VTTETGNQQAQSQNQAQQAPAGDERFASVGHALEKAAHEQFTLAVQPVLDDVRGRMMDITRRHSLGGFDLSAVPPPQHTVRSALSNTWRSVLVFALASGRRQSERALRSALQAALDAAYSDALRARIQQDSKERVRRLARETFHALPENARNKGVQRRIERYLADMHDAMVDALFVDALRGEVQADGERAIRALIGGNVTSARQGGEEAVQLLLSQTIAVVDDHWARAVPELVSVALEGIQPDSASTTENSESTENSHSSSQDQVEAVDMPKTILHSDQRAQDIWKKAHEEAARKGSENGQARRAAYDALKQAYERKGDRWVKKQDSASSDSGRGSDSKSSERDRAPKSDSKPANSGSETPKRRSSSRSKSGSASGRSRT